MLIGGILGYVFREKLLSTVDREMKSSLRLYDHRKSIRNAWDATQSTVSNVPENDIVIFYGYRENSSNQIMAKLIQFLAFVILAPLLRC